MIICNGSYSVYMHINKINGKVYVGITKQKPTDRWKRGSTYKGSLHFYSAIQKHGWDQFEHVIFAANLTEEEAKNMEELLIQQLHTQDPEYGYNITSGGDVPISYSKLVKKKISNAVSGEKHPCFGKHLSEETKQRISESERGKKKPSIAEKKSIPVVCVETNIIYPSAKIASETTGIQRTGIVAVLKGRRETAGGFHWDYYHQLQNIS